MSITRLALSAAWLLSACPSDPTFQAEDASRATDTNASDTSASDVVPDTIDTIDDAATTRDSETPLDTTDTSPTDTSATDSTVFETVDIVDPEVSSSAACGPGMLGAQDDCSCSRIDCTAAVPVEDVADAVFIINDSVRPVVAVGHPSTVSRELDVAAFAADWTVTRDVLKQFNAPLGMESDQGNAIILHADAQGRKALGWQPNSGAYVVLPIEGSCEHASLDYDVHGARAVVLCSDDTDKLRFYQTPNRSTALTEMVGSPLSITIPSADLVTSWSIAPNGDVWALAAVPSTGGAWSVETHALIGGSWSPHPIGDIPAVAPGDRLAAAIVTDSDASPHVLLVEQAQPNPATLVHFYDNGGTWAREPVPGAVGYDTRLRVARARWAPHLYVLAVEPQHLSLYRVETHTSNALVSELHPENAVRRASLLVEAEAPWILTIDVAEQARFWRPPID